MHAIYSPYLVLPIKKILQKNLRHFARDENILTMKFARITVFSKILKLCTCVDKHPHVNKSIK